jgi:hypothetical protein
MTLTETTFLGNQGEGGAARRAGGGLALPQGGRVRARRADRGGAAPRELRGVPSAHPLGGYSQ